MWDSFTTPGTVARQVPVHGICRARILQWAALSFSGGSSRPGDGTRVSRVAGGFFPTEPPGKVPWKCAHVSKLKTAEFKRIQLTVLKITLQLFFNRTPVPATTEVTAHTKKGKKQKNKPKMKNAWVKSLFLKNGAVCRPGLTSPWPVFPFSARASGVGVEGGAEGWRRATHQTGDRKGWSTSVLREHATARAAKRWEQTQAWETRGARQSGHRAPGMQAPGTSLALPVSAVQLSFTGAGGGHRPQACDSAGERGRWTSRRRQQASPSGADRSICETRLSSDPHGTEADMSPAAATAAWLITGAQEAFVEGWWISRCIY